MSSFFWVCWEHDGWKGGLPLAFHGSVLMRLWLAWTQIQGEMYFFVVGGLGLWLFLPFLGQASSKRIQTWKFSTLDTTPTELIPLPSCPFPRIPPSIHPTPTHHRSTGPRHDPDPEPAGALGTLSISSWSMVRSDCSLNTSSRPSGCGLTMRMVTCTMSALLVTAMTL